MKPLFFLLCSLNVVLLLWEFHSGAINPALPTVETPSMLLRVDEYARAQRGAAIAAILDARLDTEQAAALTQSLNHLRSRNRMLQPALFKAQPKVVAAVKPIPPPPPLPPVRKCFEAGPFADQPSLKKWLKDKALSGGEPIIRETAVPSDYQVYYPVAKTPEQLRNNKALLNDKGINDTWMINDGDIKGALSLGVFSDRQRASIFREQLAQRGISADIRQRAKTKQQLFARIMLDKPAQQQLERQPVELAPCPLR